MVENYGDGYETWCEDCGNFLDTHRDYRYPNEDSRGVTTACVICYTVNYALTDEHVAAIMNAYYEETEDE